MALRPRVRKLVLTTHVSVSVGWIGAVVAYLTLGLAAVKSDSTSTVRAAWIGMEITGWYAIVPLAVASMLTGLVMALGTRWGLFRHYWVLISFVLTVLSVVVLVLHMPDVSSLATTAQTLDGEALAALGGDLAHPGIGLMVLIAIQVLNVYKPSGLTPYGWRKRQPRT
jgi:hypothetical protein